MKRPVWWRPVGLSGCLLFLGIAVGVSAASGDTLWQVTVTNKTGVGVNDMHLVFGGTGGLLGNVQLVAPAGAAQTNFPQPNANGVNATFNAALANNGVATVKFTTPFETLTFEGGFWTRTGNPDITINGPDVQIALVETFPALNAWGMGILCLAMLGAGAWAHSRRVRRNAVARTPSRA